MISTSYKFSLRAASAALLCASAPALLANHPVVLEGNCNVPPAGNAAAAVGVCGDWDGDGVIGVDEDNDGDRVFGTFAGANGAAGAANNGTITIVASGVFAEPMVLTGNITVQAAPGVEANFDAVLQGDELWLRGLVGSPDGATMLYDEVRGPASTAGELGVTLAEKLLSMGAGEILAAVYGS